MDWVDRHRSPSRERFVRDENVELLKEQLALTESKITLIEEKWQMECVRNKILSEELKRHKLQPTCLSKCLKVAILSCLVYVLFSSSFSSCN